MLILFSWMRPERNNRGQANATRRDVFKNLHNSALSSCPPVEIKCSGFTVAVASQSSKEKMVTAFHKRNEFKGRKQERHVGKTWGLILADRSHVNKYFWSKITKISFSSSETWRVPSYRQLLTWNLQKMFHIFILYWSIFEIYTSVEGETEFMYEALICCERTVFFRDKNNKLGFEAVAALYTWTVAQSARGGVMPAGSSRHRCHSSVGPEGRRQWPAAPSPGKESIWIVSWKADPCLL